MSQVKAVGYRVGRVLRAQWRATLVLTLIVAAVTGVVLALATGAKRTATAPDRYVASRGDGFDASIQQESGPPRTAEVAGLPGVAAAEGVTFVFGALARTGQTDRLDTLIFAGSYHALGTRVVTGREPDPASKDEFVATRSFADAKGVEVGARFDLTTLTQGQADRAGFDAFGEVPGGPSLEAVLVGVVDGPTQLDDPTPLAILPRPLLDDPDIGVSATVMSVRLRPGTDLGAFRAQLDTLPDGDAFSLEPAEIISDEVRTAVRGQALGLWLLAAVGAIAAVAVLGQLLTRSVRLSADERPALAAIGFSKAQLMADQVARAAVPLVVGSALGAAVAVTVSSVFPTGFVRRMEVNPGVLVHPGFLAVCTACLLAALLLWTAAALVVARPVRGEQPSALVESVAARTGSATVATGFRFAFTRSNRDRGSVRAAVTGMLLTTAIVVGAVVFGSSVGRLVTDGSRFGTNYDLLFGSGGDSVPDELRATLETDPDVAALIFYAAGQARVGAVTIRLAAMQPVRGDLAPKVLVGRLPSADDEIALGRLVADTLGTQVGADLTVEGEAATHRFRVTGFAVVPGVEGLDGVGQDAVLTFGGLTRLDTGAQLSVAAVRLRPGAPPDTAQRLAVDGGLALDETDLGPGTTPAVIRNLARIRSVPYLLALLVGALAVLTVVQVMVTSVHNRRRDVAVLRALGADGGWITRAVHWQATAFSLVPLALGVPVGLIVGRLVFETFANSIGTVPDASFPFVLLAGVFVGLVVLANAVAEVPARRARRLVPAVLLNPE